jgi:hypothetical protein
MAKTKLTREEKAEQAKAERTAQKVAEFKAKIARERGKRTYTEAEAFRHDAPIEDINSQRFSGACPSCGQEFVRSGMALYEMVRRYKNAKESLARELGRLRSSLEDAAKRMAVNDRPAWHSNGIVGGQGVEIDRYEQEAWTLAECTARLAWATGWYVPDVMADRDNALRAKLLSLRVERDLGAEQKLLAHLDAEGAVGSDTEVWRVYVGEKAFTRRDFIGPERPEEPMIYRSETSAWVAAGRLVGETLDGY